MTYIFSIEGNIGSGKSTLVHMLQDTFGDTRDVIFLEEPVSVWNTIKDATGETMLEKFYKDQERNAFSFQMMAYISRIALLKRAIRENPNAILLCERSVFTDKNVFAKMLFDDGLIRDVDYQIYLKWFDEFVEEIPLTGIIYVRADPEKSFERVKKRSRKGEDIPLAYLEKCHRYHEDWMKQSTQDVMILDANTDYEFTPKAYASWVNIIRKFISYRAHNELKGFEVKEQNKVDFERAIEVARLGV